MNPIQSKELVISESVIRKFEINEKKQKYLPLKNYIKILMSENKEFSFASRDLYHRFLRISPNILKDKSSLSFFRETLGLDKCLFKSSVQLQSEDGFSVDCPKRLLKVFFEYFKVMLHSGLKESQESKISLPIGESALKCFENYLLTAKIVLDDQETTVTTIKDLINFSHMTNVLHFQEAVGEAIIDYSYRNELDDSLLEVLGDQAEYVKKRIELNDKFVKRFFERNGIEPRELNGDYCKISLSDFLKIFTSQTHLKTLNFLSTKIRFLDDIEIDCKSLAALYTIPKKYRNAISSIENGNMSLDRLQALFICFQQADFNYDSIELTEEIIEKEIQDDTDKSFAYFILSNKMEGSEQEAKLYKAIKLDSRNAFALAKLGDVLSLKDQLDEAEKWVRQAIAINPKNAFALRVLGEVLRQQDQLDEAEKWLNKSMEIDSKHGFTLATLGDVLRQQGQLVKAEQLLRQAIEINSKDSFTLSSLGDVLRQQGKLAEAKKWLTQSIEIDPNYIFCLLTLSEVLDEMNELDEAKIYLKKSIEIDPEDRYAYELLEKILTKERNLEEARENDLRTKFSAIEIADVDNQ